MFNRMVVSLMAAILVLGATAGFAASATDAPDKCNQAGSVSPTGSWIKGTIGSSTDVDWYRFDVPRRGRMQVVLGGLPADYDLDVFSWCGTQPFGDHRSGTEFEELVMRRNDSAGDVFVRVRSAAGASSTEPYKLRFRILPAGLVILSSNSYVDAGGLRHIIGDVITTADAFRSVKATATLYDSADAVIGTVSHRTMLRKLVQRTGLRSPFEIVFDPPPGYDHYTLTVSGIKANSEALERLKIELKTPYTDDLDVGHFPGRLTNNNNFAIDSLEMFVTVYNAEARVINVGQAATNKVLVPKFDGTRFDATFVDHFASWNRFRAVAQAVVAP